MSRTEPDYERIFLQPFAGDENTHTWCRNRIHDDDIEYVRADINASQKAEIDRLRAVISKCADALGNGAYIAPTASVEFMERLPLETSMRIAALSETSNGKD